MEKTTVKQMIEMLQECKNPQAEVVLHLYTEHPLVCLRFDGTGEEDSNRLVLGLNQEDHDAVTDRLDVLEETKETIGKLHEKLEVS